MIALNIHRDKAGFITVMVPENWEELTPAQFVAIAGNLHLGIPVATVAMNFLIGLLGRYRKWVATCARAPEALVSEALPLLEWIGEPADFLKQPVPVIGKWPRRWYGPEAGFRNLRFSEFHFAEVAFWSYTESKDLQHLRELVAVLWRPEQAQAPAGDCRQRLETAQLETRMGKQQPQLSEMQLHAIGFWYVSTRQQLVEDHPRIFRQSEGEDGSDELPSYFPLMRAIAKEGTHGDFEKVEQMFLLNALEELEAAKDEEEAMKQAIKDAQTE